MYFQELLFGTLSRNRNGSLWIRDDAPANSLCKSIFEGNRTITRPIIVSYEASPIQKLDFELCREGRLREVWTPDTESDDVRTTLAVEDQTLKSDSTVVENELTRILDTRNVVNELISTYFDRGCEEFSLDQLQALTKDRHNQSVTDKQQEFWLEDLHREFVE